MKYRYRILCHWCPESPGCCYRIYTYVEAKRVVRVGHERIIADGVVIDLIGNIMRITKPKKPL